jgi:hypothetical protein
VLPGTNQLSGVDGVLDIFGMRSYWNALKQKINDLQNLGPVISVHQQKLGVAYTDFMNSGRKDLADALHDEIAKTQDDLDKWWKVKGYIDSYLPEWMKLDEGEPTAPTSGVSGRSDEGLGQLILAGMALTALAYCVNVGLALLQDYAFKSQLTTAVIEQKMTSGQAAEILSVPKQEGVLEKVVENVGVGAAIGIPTVLLVGGGLYLVFATGLLKNIFGGGSGSQSSSGG